jgi:chemotaxis response regulator CheB
MDIGIVDRITAYLSCWGADFRLIVVVLAGRGDDAATGVSVVHRFGGTVIACTAATSSHQAVPPAEFKRGRSRLCGRFDQ